MSQKGIEQLVGRALTDRNFMEAVIKDPEGEISKAKAQKFAESFATEFGPRKQQAFG